MRIFRILTITVSILFFWQIIIWVGQLPDYILPSPIQVMTTLLQKHQLISSEARFTIIETLLGLALGLMLGLIAALLMAFFKTLSSWFLPLLIISQAIPTFAIAPLLVIWLGYGLASKIVTTILMLFFPVTSAFYDGLSQINSEWLHLAKTMNASKWRIFLFIKIPAALPRAASGIRIAAVIAPMGAIVGEWVGSSHGLGYLMLNANARMQIDLLFAALLVLVVLSILLYFSIDLMLRKFIYW